MIPHHKNTSLQNIIATIDGIVYTEEWKSTIEAPGRYHISSFGRLKRLSRPYKERSGFWKEKIISPGKTRKGYLRFILKDGENRYSRYAHRLVAIAFIPRIEGKPCVNHKTAIKTDNHYSQLEWCTDAENNKHAWELGIFDGANSRIPKEQRRFIKENFFTIGREKLAEMFGLTDKYILSVAKVKLSGTDQRKKGKPKYKKVIDINTGTVYNSAKEVSKLTGTCFNTLRRGLSGERYNRTPYRYFVKGKVQDDILLPPPPKVKVEKPKFIRPPKKEYIPHPLPTKNVIMSDISGKELRVFASSKEAAEHIGTKLETFRKWIRSTNTGFHKGFNFKYA